MRKRVAWVSVPALLLLFAGFAWAQAVGGRDPFKVDPYRIDMCEEALYLEPDVKEPGRFTLMLSARVVVDVDPLKKIPVGVLVTTGLAPLGDWIPMSSMQVQQEQEGTKAYLASEKVRPGMTASYYTIPLASIDVPPDEHNGSGTPSFASLFSSKQIVSVKLTLRRQGFGAGFPPLAEKAYDLKPLNYALLEAAAEGNVSLMKELLNKGADPDAATVQNWTALMEAAAKRRPRVVALLLREKVGVDVKHKGFPFIVSYLGSVMPGGETALMVACSAGDPETVRLLLDNKASVAAERSDRWTALLAAAYSGKAEIVRMLLAKGAEVGATSETGYSAGALALINGNAEALAALKVKALEEGEDTVRVPWDLSSQDH